MGRANTLISISERGLVGSELPNFQRAGRPKWQARIEHLFTCKWRANSRQKMILRASQRSLAQVLYDEGMRYRLRTLLLVCATLPAVLGIAWHMPAIGLAT